MGRKKKTDRDATSHLAHDVLILHLFQLFNRIEEQRSLGQLRRKTNEAAGSVQIDPRTLENALRGYSISPMSAAKIADALSKKLRDLIDEIGGPDKLLEEMNNSLQWSDPARAFQWLEDRIKGLPPYIHQGDIIVNRNDRHLVDDYNISLAVGPCPGSKLDIPYAEKKEPPFPYNTMALLKYSLTFSPHNRDRERDFVLRYSSDGKIELIDPEPDGLKDPAGYRRNRDSFLLTPDPKITTPQRVAAFLYAGAYDFGDVNTHFSFTQNALYRRIDFTLDLTTYPNESIIQEPRLFVVCKLPGRTFDCCQMASTGEGQTIQPSQTIGQRRIWKFESFEQMMIGVHWKIDKEKLPKDERTSREQLLALLADDQPSLHGET